MNAWSKTTCQILVNVPVKVGSPAQLSCSRSTAVTCAIKVKTLYFQKDCSYLRQWKSFKNDEKCFYLMFKALFVFEVLSFLSWLLGYVEKRLDKKAKVNFKIDDVTYWTTNNYNTLLNISRSKGNQTMKFGQLVELKMRNIFLEKLYPTFHTQSFPATEASPIPGLWKYIKTKVLPICFDLI